MHLWAEAVQMCFTSQLEPPLKGTDGLNVIFNYFILQLFHTSELLLDFKDLVVPECLTI